MKSQRRRPTKGEDSDAVSAPADSTSIGAPRRFVERAALLILLALIPLRALLNETHSFEMMRAFRKLPPGTQPGTTFLIVALIAATAAAVGVARLWRGGRSYRRTGAELGAALLLIAGAVSTWRAGQKHLALIGTLDFLGMIVYLLTLRQLLTRPWHIRLVMAVVLATGATVVAKCAYQKWVEFPNTVEFYEQHKAEYTSPTAGGDADVEAAGLIYDYEQRLRGSLVSGYLGHSNVLGSYLILVIMAAIAVASARFRRRAGLTMAFPLLTCVGAIATLVLAQSKGAAAACAIAGIVWVIGQWISARRPAPATHNSHWLVVWLAIAVGAAGLVGVLSAKPAALGRSMLFRYQYWQGAVGMLRDQGWLGVGADNFGRFFPRYKPVECPEDVDSPHSWVVQMATEWGALGPVGLFVLLIGVSRVIGRGSAAQEPPALAGGHPQPPARDAPRAIPPQAAGRGLLGKAGSAGAEGGSIVHWLGGVAAIAFGLFGWSMAGSDPSFWAWSMLVALVPWLIGFLAISIESTESTQFLDDLPGPLLAGLCAGLIGFVIHTGVDLAMFKSGAATTFFALLAAALAVREINSGSVQPCTSPQPWLMGAARLTHRIGALSAGAVGVVCTIAILIALARPAVELGDNLQAARENSTPSPWLTYEMSPGFAAYQRAVVCYRLDGTAVEELIEELTLRAISVQQVDAVLGLVDEFGRRDPANSAVWQDAATLYSRRFQFGGEAADLDRAVAAMRASVAAYPTSPTRRLALGDLLEKQAETTGSAAARQAAAAELRKALDLDERRIYVSAPHRLPQQMRTGVEERIKALLSNPG